jgi:hypothetical protein
VARPPEKDSRPAPLWKWQKTPGITTVGLQTRRVYHSLLRAQACCLIPYILLRCADIFADPLVVLDGRRTLYRIRAETH